jgi:surface antigen
MARISAVKCTAPIVLLAFGLALTSCASMEQTWQDNPRAVVGSLGGAALGGGIAALAGGGAGWIVASTLAGGLIGGYVGKKLDDHDKQMLAATSQRAFESNRTGQTSTWRNPDSGNSGSITPTKTYEASSGQYCREYQQTIVVGGEKQQAYGTACRQPDGSWKVQS